MTEPLSHMPFLTYDRDGRRILLFAQADDCLVGETLSLLNEKATNGSDSLQRSGSSDRDGTARSCWKLFYSVDDGEPQRLETGFPHGTIECSPSGWQDESGWHVTFIAMDDTGVYRLYRMDGPSLDSLSTPVSLRPARTGFVYKDRLVVGEIQDLVHVHDTDGDHRIELPGTFIYRVSYRADEPQKLLISGDWIGENEEPFTVEYNLTDDSQRFIECDGHGAYKCTIYGDEILYAERCGEQFEHRRIRRSDDFHGVCCQMAHRHGDSVSETQLKISKKCGCRRNRQDDLDDDPVRPSCLECTEKHLGAAHVIMSEIHDGYAYRLRFIGHLHEAEDESQEWPSLHVAIRQARKEYQRSGTTPDWETLARLIEEARHDC